MKSIILYEYDRKNWDNIMKALPPESNKVSLISLRVILQELVQGRYPAFDSDYIDLTLSVMGEEDRIDLWTQTLICVFQEYERQNAESVFIIDKRFSASVKDALFYYIKSCESLEKLLGIDDSRVTNIVDLDKNDFDKLNPYLNKNLFGNERFKKRLCEELVSFRYFNTIGHKKVFSLFVFGQTGIGKTETARLLHEFLSPHEKFIKINLGNYGDANALSSLIGSPRGYIGSNKGELTDKIEKSKSHVILIDEFEKAGREIHNFFLELLADGQFTDSLGREFDLDKYIIIFTSNIREENFTKRISPELQSRFDLVFKLSALTNEEKLKYVDFKVEILVEKFTKNMDIIFSQEDIESIKKIDVNYFDNLRKLNRQIERNITNVILDKGK